MATRREIKRRIGSIRNTAQITKAMQMVSASRMRRAQQRVAAARPYAENITEIMADVSARPGAGEHLFLTQRDVQKLEVVLISPDRGLAGALVTNINREFHRLATSVNRPVRVIAVGRKGRDFALRSRYEVVADYSGLGDHVGIADVAPIANQAVEDYRSGEADVVYLVYSQFVSTLRQQPRSDQILPAVPPKDVTITAPWNYEPDNPGLVLSELVPRFVEFSIYHAMLESLASEHSARMIAMSNATDNALELIDDLTLVMNKARQAEITKEIADITGAAEAIRTSA
jgi:F-type H+-transporting ATPase subunit gamma